MPPSAEGQAAERHRLGDLQRRQSPMRIQPIAHRGAGHRGEAQIVRQRIGAERGEGDAAVATPCGRRRSCRAGRRASARRRTGRSRRSAISQRAQRDVLQRGGDVVAAAGGGIPSARHRSRRSAAATPRIAGNCRRQALPMLARALCRASSVRRRRPGAPARPRSARPSRRCRTARRSRRSAGLPAGRAAPGRGSRTRRAVRGTGGACRPRRRRSGSPRRRRRRPAPLSVSARSASAARSSRVGWR